MEFVSILLALVAGLLIGWFLAQKDVSRMREKLAGVEAQADYIRYFRKRRLCLNSVV